MAKRANKKKFNNPFADLKKRKDLVVKTHRPSPDKNVAGTDHRSDEDEDDAELFARAVHGIIPMDRTDSRVEPAKRLESALPDDEQLARLELESLIKGQGDFVLFDEEEEHSGRAPGVSRELVNDLRRGRFSFRKHLDLHHLTREEAKTAVIKFLTKARREGERCVLVVTGRGKRSPAGVAVLQETLPRWLSRAPLRSHVLAFCSAQRVDGGTGALYILLRRPGARPYGRQL